MRYGKHEFDDGYVARSILPRLAAGLVPVGDCLVWSGKKSKDGYGQISAYRTDGKQVLMNVHRLVFTLAKGDPGSAVCDHGCRNRACGRLEHIEPVTVGINSKRGLVYTAETRLKISLSKRGKKMPPGFSDACRRRRLGQRHTPEALAKVRAALARGRETMAMKG